jgi:hypothetical protein
MLEPELTIGELNSRFVELLKDYHRRLEQAGVVETLEESFDFAAWDNQAYLVAVLLDCYFDYDTNSLVQIISELLNSRSVSEALERLNKQQEEEV